VVGRGVGGEKRETRGAWKRGEKPKRARVLGMMIFGVKKKHRVRGSLLGPVPSGKFFLQKGQGGGVGPTVTYRREPKRREAE